MVAKRVSRRKEAAKSNLMRLVPDLTETAVLPVVESEGTPRLVATTVDAELRRQMVAAAAYFIAEGRGFAVGHELEDWVAAEAAVDAQLREVLAA